MAELERISRAANGEIARLDFGASRPYLVTHPDHVQQVLRRESETFIREGTFWRPLAKLFGDSIMSEGAVWEHSKRVLQPVFSTRHLRTLTDAMAEAINTAIDKLEEPAREGRPIQVMPEMSRIVNETVIKILFGGKITPVEADRLIPAMEQVATSIAFRFLLPFVPDAIPLPGDRAYREGERIMDETLYELVERYRDDPGEGTDIFTALCNARTADGAEPTAKWLRDNLMAMFATSTETTSTALTWLWPLLHEHPDVAARLKKEIREVVGRDRVTVAHLRELPYVTQVIQELLRLYPVGWAFSRIATKPTTLGGVEIKPGDIVIISPYLTHHLESVWDRPYEFDPERFRPDRARTYHRYAYYPFGGGPHQCIGRHVFNAEAQLILTGILSRFDFELTGEVPARPRIGATLRPKVEVEMRLIPLEAGSGSGAE
ncbi:MAG: cytochrome P450 [Actinomadura rubrobrunea]|nr:cytochrome P450 [Actinomadura rubrobrunea]